jgi:hypothetical protein
VEHDDDVYKRFWIGEWVEEVDPSGFRILIYYMREGCAQAWGMYGKLKGSESVCMLWSEKVSSLV